MRAWENPLSLRAIGSNLAYSALSLRQQGKTLLSYNTRLYGGILCILRAFFSFARWSLTNRYRGRPCKAVVCHQHNGSCSALVLSPKAPLLWITGAHRCARSALDEFKAA